MPPQPTPQHPPETRDTDTHGHHATTPWAIPAGGWRDVVLRSWREAGQDNVSLIASGVAFCAVLAIVPMLGAIVLTYGLVATPQTVLENVRSLASVMPADAARLIGEQLANLVNGADDKKGIGLVIALGIALYGAMKGASAIITALNIAYDEEETRGFVALNLLALAITVGALILALLAIVSVTALAALETLFPNAPGVLLVLGKILSYVVMAGVGAAATATLYHFAPNRDGAKWRWLTPGSVLAAVSWLIMTLGFGFYVANFGSYDATYGSLGAAIVLLTWLYLSAYVLLLGAEFNCGLERQTVRDTTTGPEQPMGQRGAYAADTVAGDGDEPVAPTGGLAGPREGSPPPRTPVVRGFAVSRLTAGVAARSGGARLGTLPPALATIGLALLRRRNRAALGSVLLITASGLAWFGSDPARERD